MGKVEKYFLIIGLFPIFLGACSSVTQGPISGRITDAANDKPIAGALVWATWSGDIVGFDTKTDCFHLEVATTDKDGIFYIQNWNILGVDTITKHLSTYNKRGLISVYAHRMNIDTAQLSRKGEYNFKLHKSFDSSDERANTLSKIGYMGFCSDKDSRASERMALEKVLMEVKELPSSERQKSSTIYLEEVIRMTKTQDHTDDLRKEMEVR